MSRMQRELNDVPECGRKPAFKYLKLILKHVPLDKAVKAAVSRSHFIKVSLAACVPRRCYVDCAHMLAPSFLAA